MITFEELELKKEILHAIDDLGFQNPTPIQEKTIPHILNSKQDLLAFAQTGTGKTAAFSLPLIHQIDEEISTPQMLILCPTRELCLQITNDLKSFLKYLTNIKTTAVYGGDSIDKQIKLLRQGTQVVVATPGRMVDLIRRKKIELNAIRWLVLDEADEMLTMGFKDDLDAILSQTPDEKQTLLFSATKQEGIMRMVRKFMRKPLEITAGKSNVGAVTLKHIYYMVRAKDRYEALKRIVDFIPSIYGIIFCRTRRETQEIATKLNQDAYNVEAIHGDLSQEQREHVMRRFRNQKTQMLIATDVAARGIDVSDLNYVINYNLPENLETYIHRTGRTGRAGKEGTAISIIHSKEQQKIRQLENKLQVKIEKKSVPNGEEVFEKKLFKMVEDVKNMNVDTSLIHQYTQEIGTTLQNLSKEEVIERFFAFQMKTLSEFYKNSEDLNVKPSKRSKENSRNNQNRERDFNKKQGNFTKLKINLGRQEQVSPGELIHLINDLTGNKNIKIGKIQINNSFSMFEVESQHKNTLLDLSNEYTIDDTLITIQPYKESLRGGGRRRKKRK